MKWEYAIVFMDYKVERRGEDDWAWDTEWTIAWPSGELEVRQGWGTDHPDSPVRARHLLTELGAQGWELVSDVSVRSGVVATHGWAAGSRPVAREWTLKRPAAGDQH